MAVIIILLIIISQVILFVAGFHIGYWNRIKEEGRREANILIDKQRRYLDSID